MHAKGEQEQKNIYRGQASQSTPSTTTTTPTFTTTHYHH
jgi:hypothetical protein